MGILSSSISIFLVCLSLLSLQAQVLAQSQDQDDSVPPAGAQNATFNATHGQFNPTTARTRIAQANLSAARSEAILTAVNFERSNWAGFSTRLDPFYVDVPSNASHAPAGSVIKVEQVTNTSLYTLPANVALSRMLFMTKTLNGTAVPASAYILWPWMPRRFQNVSGLPIVAWGHGTSGWSGECGPSHIRNLWYQYSAPYVLALQGYVVVAPDYAGLGLDHDAEGGFIAHQYLAHPAHGSDLIHAVQAAQQAWPSLLAHEFVVMGHSQGGGAAWGAAQLLAKNPVKGYLGTVAGSPSTSTKTLIQQSWGSSASLGSMLTRVGTGINSVFPTFQMSDWLSAQGVRVTELLQDLQGCQSVAYEMTGLQTLVNPRWNETWYLDAFDNLTSNGGQAFAGPMLVLQGTNDTSVFVDSVTSAVNATCNAYRAGQLEYVTFEGVGHVSVLYAGQQIWLDWIADRFGGVDAPRGCKRVHYQPQFAVEVYQKEAALFLEYPLYGYETA
ncbi:hypothetical protein HRR83_004866 [Exophiala dermatitidis]|uniref:Secretory lipase n=2 Tax=Exophiala dermatitidis TaxID=5970 RepID=H6C3R0_EXODN|nr:secretory lipase [Exophiala dermatitidis NIH/UT8656]KAJ4513968.1 hypothetical protein HRR75_004549 [Exophiala dermatitidis]EHY58275.1 secretory lipase [Exophiala dermatitidis NIH/UT8656]KAJ4517219.1 hypothetical protein HRR74_004969 [Exophiala dermatitidis]KAJ4519604.1 hypothetical protein HRR73_003664 [Exophiala dermatitidis]KAJ4534598.1 hypothetical protein HRR76_006519 [Exophiala dermatitidis]